MDVEDLKEMRPIRLVVSDAPVPLVWIGEGENLADVTEAVERLAIEVLPGGVIAQLTLRVDLEFDFPVDRVAVPGSADWLDDVTADDLSQVCAAASMSEPLGSALIRHLRARAGSRP